MSERHAKFRKRLIKHLKGGEAFMPLENFIDNIPFEDLGKRSENLPYSFYELFFHIRYAQKDILDFCKAETYKTPNWPNDYWPEISGPENKASWEKLKKNYFDEREEFADFIMDTGNKLLEPVKHGGSEEQNLLREILLVIEHTSYHTGQLLVIARLLGAYS